MVIPNPAPSAPSDARSGALAPTTLANRIYLTVWRWHFYAGLYVTPFLVMLALTGLVILFQPQLEEAQYRDRVFVVAGARALSLEAQFQAVTKAYPTGAVGSVTPPTAADRSTQFAVTPKDAPQLTVFVNPYTAQVLGHVQNNRRWGDIASNIHGSILLGETGDRLIEIAAGLGILLLVSGIYMWWPRGKNGLYGTLIPRFNAGKRTMWRDLHVVPGFYIGAALLAFLITGMSWTGVWGGQFVQAWNTFPAKMWNDVPKSDKTHATLNPSHEKVTPWNLEQTPLPASGSLTGKPGIPQGLPINFDSVTAFAKANGFDQSFTVNAPRDDKGVWTVAASSMSRQVNDARKDLTIHIDQYSGQVLAKVGWNDYSLGAQAMASGVALHQGGLGTWNVVLNTVFCAFVLLISVSGMAMWWLRRPAGAFRLVAPPPPKSMPLWKGATLIIIALGFAFPLAGLTLLGVVLLDFFVLSRIKPLKVFFS